MLADGYLCSRHEEQRQETQLNWDRCQRGCGSARGASGSGRKQEADQSRLVDWSLSTLGSNSGRWGCRHHLSTPLIFLVLTDHFDDEAFHASQMKTHSWFLRQLSSFSLKCQMFRHRWLSGKVRWPPLSQKVPGSNQHSGWGESGNGLTPSPS